MTLPPARRIALVALAIVTSALCSGAGNVSTPWTVRIWTADGLTDRTIVGVAQTRDGFLWVATPRALARFDGVRFENFLVAEFATARDARIRALLTAHDGALWVAMDRGPLVRIAPEGTRVIQYGLPGAAIDSLVEDGDGAIWLSFRSGSVALCRWRDGTVSRYGVDAGLSTARCVLAVDRQGRLWVAQNGEVGLFRNGSFEKLPQRASASARITARAGGGLWVAASNGLFIATEHGLQRRDLSSGPRFGAFPFAMLEDHTGALWIGTTPDGLFRYTERDGLERIPTSYPEISCVAEDREGNIWAGTAGGGLNRVSPRAVTLEGDATGFPQQSIQTVCEDRDGVLWAATQNGVLVVRAVDGAWRSQPKWPTGVTCLAADPQGGIWIGTRKRALYRLRGETLDTWTIDQGLASHTVGVVAVARDGTVWLGEEGPTAMQRWRDGHLTQLALPSGMNYVEALTEDAQGRMWIGGDGGELLRAEGDRLIDETPVGAPRVALRGLHATPDGTLWLGYRGAGLGRLNSGRFSLIDPEHGLFSGSVVHVVSDDRGWLWCGGDDGVFKVRIQSAEAFAQGRTNWVQSVHYGSEQGLPTLQATAKAWGSAMRSRDGKIWIPMATALVIADPERARENLEAPPVFLTHVKVDGASVARYGGVLPPVTGRHDAGLTLPITTPLAMKPVRQKLEFDFTALSFTAPENVQFRYRLEPFDEDWVEAGANRMASYVRVPAGHYTFRVQACNSDGVWNQTGATLAVVIAPFFWQTWWFRSAVVLAFTAGTTLVVRQVSHRRLRRKVEVLQQQMMLERERTRIARDLHDDAGNRLTRVSLLSQLAWRDRAQPDKAASHLEQLSTAAREATNAFDEIVWAVNPQNDNLAELIAYLGQFAQEFCQTAGIRCVVDVPVHVPDRNVPTDVRHNLFLVTKEAIHNVVRHARASEVRLRVSVTDDGLVIVVADDGRGIAGAARAPGADGLRNFQARMAEIGGRFEIDTAPDAGTRLTFAYGWPQ